MPRLTNDTHTLSPVVNPDGPALALDFPGLEIGVAEYAEGPTGCTVFHVPDGGMLAVDVRGGSPGWIGDYGRTHAICLAGGSIHGLEATSGLVAELFAEHDRNFVAEEPLTAWDITFFLAEPEPVPAEVRTALLAITDVSVLADGRAGAFVVSTNPFTGPDTVYMVFVR